MFDPFFPPSATRRPRCAPVSSSPLLPIPSSLRPLAQFLPDAFGTALGRGSGRFGVHFGSSLGPLRTRSGPTFSPIACGHPRPQIPQPLRPSALPAIAPPAPPRPNTFSRRRRRKTNPPRRAIRRSEGPAEEKAVITAAAKSSRALLTFTMESVRYIVASVNYNRMSAIGSGVHRQGRDSHAAASFSPPRTPAPPPRALLSRFTPSRFTYRQVSGWYPKSTGKYPVGIRLVSGSYPLCIRLGPPFMSSSCHTRDSAASATPSQHESCLQLSAAAVPSENTFRLDPQ